jgi:hypothetical protein
MQYLRKVGWAFFFYLNKSIPVCFFFSKFQSAFVLGQTPVHQHISRVKVPWASAQLTAAGHTGESIFFTLSSASSQTAASSRSQTCWWYDNVFDVGKNEQKNG